MSDSPGNEVDADREAEDDLASTILEGRTMISRSVPDPEPVAHPHSSRLHRVTTLVMLTIGAVAAVVVACAYGIRNHTVVVMFVMAYATVFGVFSDMARIRCVGAGDRVSAWMCAAHRPTALNPVFGGLRNGNRQDGCALAPQRM